MLGCSLTEGVYMSAKSGKAMDSTRRTALVTGVLFIITFVASIPAVLLYSPVLHHTNYILGAGADTRVYWGALLEVITLVAGIGTAVVLFPIVKRQNESVALGYVTARVIESMIIMAGILSLMAIVTLRQDLAGVAGTDAGSLVIAGRSLLAVHKWSFLMGPGLLGSGLGNGLLLGYLMYRSGLVPRPWAVLGLIGGTCIVRFGDRRPLRRHRGGLQGPGHSDGPGVRVGGLPRHLPHVLGIQGVSDHH